LGQKKRKKKKVRSSPDRSKKDLDWVGTPPGPDWGPTGKRTEKEKRKIRKLGGLLFAETGGGKGRKEKNSGLRRGMQKKKGKGTPILKSQKEEKKKGCSPKDAGKKKPKRNRRP